MLPRPLPLILVLITVPAMAQTVTDGDTIKLDGVRWRLWGIDAPELHQTCADGWPAGIESTHALERLMAAGPVHCEDRGRDRYRPSIGLCRAGRRDLGSDMVSAGLAWAFTQLGLHRPGAGGDRRAARRARARLHEGLGLASAAPLAPRSAPYRAAGLAFELELLVVAAGVLLGRDAGLQQAVGATAEAGKMVAMEAHRLR